MKVCYWKILMLFYFSKSCAIYSDMTQVVHKIINDFQPNKIIVFSNFSKRSGHRCNDLFRIFINHIPTNTLNLNKISLMISNKSVQTLPSVQPDQSLIYTIFQCEKNTLETTLSILTKIVSFSPITARPKCLYIVSNSIDFSQDESRKMLQEAWYLKFLDFTILRMKNGSFVSWNPFTNQYHQGYLKNTLTDLFPDKLINVNQYPLKLLMWNVLPQMLVEKRNNKVIKIDGSTYKYLKIISEKLNFNLNITFEPDDFLDNAVKNSFVKLANNKINVMPISLFLARFRNKDLVIGYPIWVTRMVMVVPNILTLGYNFFNAEMYISAISFPLLIFIFTFLINLLKHKFQNWNVFRVCQILIGTPIVQPKKSYERVIFLTIVILSMLYTNIIFSNLTNTKVKPQVQEFNTYGDVLESDLPVYSYYENLTDRSLPKDLNQILLKYKKIENNEKCIDLVFETNRAICFTTAVTANFWKQHYKYADGSPILKVANPSFRNQPLGIAFEKSSPYAEKFSKMIIKIFETQVASQLQKRPEIRFNKLTSEIEIDILLIELEVILLVGCFLATLAFIYEIRHRLASLMVKFIERIKITSVSTRQKIIHLR